MVDECLWINPAPQTPPVNPCLQPWSFDADAAVPQLPLRDEDFWVSGVAPVPASNLLLSLPLWIDWTWPIPTYTSPATWDATTLVNSTVASLVTALSTVTITITPSGSITGGHVTFEENDSGANSGWGLLRALSGGGAQQSGVALSGLTTTSWIVNAQQPSSIRVRLDAAIIGSGSILVSITAAAMPPTFITGSNFQDAVTPTGLVNGINLTYTLPAAPSPGASLLLVFQPTVATTASQTLIQGAQYTLSGATITIIVAAFNNGAFYAWSRI